MDTTDKFLLELFEGMKNFEGQYSEEDHDQAVKEQEKIQDITGNFEFWGLQ